ncbi:hypothetical protein Phum_PHUM543110 [Pediculus humanus corporis]|uniref:Uncharacterized protein n=1 Tax=Pediculus humanus subsp. corporis TaxID=121224 RepID=E0W020_PEDHC|nr:uncharacterized protein Phum_PHUM543110 [Pediculus humanus corporis]EEB18977.1 hypothetical protein Phum_PHUM543110 [Pediculus humanus corporis]
MLRGSPNGEDRGALKMEEKLEVESLLNFIPSKVKFKGQIRRESDIMEKQKKKVPLTSWHTWNSKNVSMSKISQNSKVHTRESGNPT